MPSKRQRRIKKIDNDSILDQIERVVRWSDEFRLAFVKCNHPIQRETLRRSLLERLSDQRILEIELEKPIVSLLDEIRPLWDPDQPPVAVCIYGLEHSLHEQGQSSSVLGRLNHDRDLLRQLIPAALLIWLSDFALGFVARGAPDFWAWRSGVYEFQPDRELWQVDSTAAIVRPDTALYPFSLRLEDKLKEIARLKELLSTAENFPQRDKEAQRINVSLLYQLGRLYISLGKWQDAMEGLEKARKISEALGDQDNVALVLRNIGLIHYSRGNFALALTHYEQAWKIFQSLDKQTGVASVARTLHDIGLIHYSRGNFAAAQTHFEQARKTFEVIGDQSGVADVLHNIGRIHHSQGNFAAALAYYEQAQKIFEEIGDKNGVADALNNIGEIHYASGYHKTALTHYEQAQKIFEILGNKNGMAATLRNIGMIYHVLGYFDKALANYLKARQISEALGDQKGVADALCIISTVYLGSLGIAGA